MVPADPGQVGDGRELREQLVDAVLGHVGGDGLGVAGGGLGVPAVDGQLVGHAPPQPGRRLQPGPGLDLGVGGGGGELLAHGGRALAEEVRRG